jgi:Flp pilus assembly protein TadG
MSSKLQRLSSDRRAVAAVEFAIVAPLLLMIVGGLADFGVMLWRREELAGGVAQGAQYAFTTGTSVAASDVQTIVQKTSALGTAASVSMSGPTCYCTSGSPATKSVQTCGQVCSSSNTAPGSYVTITASYTYQPIMPFFDNLTNTVVRETAFVRVQ